MFQFSLGKIFDVSEVLRKGHKVAIPDKFRKNGKGAQLTPLLWPKLFQPYPTHNQHASIAFFRFPVTKPLELKARPGRQFLLFTKLGPANHLTVLPAGTAQFGDIWVLEIPRR